MSEMKSDQGTRLAQLFSELSALDGAAREGRLASLRVREPTLAEELEDLLIAHDTAGGFLDSLPEERVAELLDTDERLARPIRAGPFELGEELGRGGLGVVYRGERNQDGFHQLAAVKLIKRGMDSDLIVQRFETERRILASLDHPGISRLIDGGVLEDGRPWFAMDLIEGQDLQAWVASVRPDLDQRLRVFESICRIVQYAHGRLIVHRDLKPANILITESGQVRLLDFGIAKLLGEDAEALGLTTAGLQVMTRDYAAPEQILGQAVSVATDVHALGVVLYELLTGQHPFRRPDQDRESLNSSICTRDPPAPSRVVVDSALARQLRGDLDAIVLTALAKAPSDRYGSVEALASDLAAHRQNRPIRARVPTRRYRLGRFLRRNRWGVAAAGVVMLALSAGLLVAANQAQRAALAAAEARAEARRSTLALGFLTDLFEASNPRRSEPVTTIEGLLEAGERQAREGLSDDPQLRDAVLVQLARLRLSRAEPEQALALAEQVIDQATERTDPPILNDARRIAGQSLYQQDRNEEARVYLQAAIEGYDEIGDRAGAALARNQLAGTLRDLGDYDGAVRAQQSVLADALERLGPDAEEVQEHRFALGVFAIDLGDYELAESTLTSVIAVLEQMPGESPVRLAMTLQTYASLLDRIGRSQEAAPLFERALGLLEQRFGGNSDPVASARFSFALFLAGQDRHAEAVEILRAVTRAEQAAQVTRAHGWRYLGRSQRALEQLELALVSFERAEQLYRDLGGQSMGLQAHRAEADRGHTLVLSGQLEPGITLLERAIEGIRSVRGDSHYDLIGPLTYLGDAMLQKGRSAAAREVFEQALTIAVAEVGEGHRFAVDLRERLASIERSP
jgi:tetratricopeptide (TPR) repeat protein/predicted Ser/Thr protein kinase